MRGIAWELLGCVAIGIVAILVLTGCGSTHIVTFVNCPDGFARIERDGAGEGSVQGGAAVASSHAYCQPPADTYTGQY